MPRSLTLRLSDDVYQKFSQMAREENRSMANLVETLAMQKLSEEIFTDTFETEEILANSALMNKLKRGHMQAELRKGVFQSHHTFLIQKKALIDPGVPS
ncbi:MAG: CopG family transcriptional regulator [Deltaproteobacteria bacterium]|nr:CopG family transcriptional regulator [Deltaproteobacteria bacterium]